MKIALITAITNNFDEPKVIPEQTVPHIRLLFTEKEVPEQYRHLDSRTQALYFKQQMHRYAPEFDVWIWVDGKIQIDRTDFIQQCLDALGDNGLAILKHGERNCVYEEINYIIKKTRAESPYFVSRFANRLDVLNGDLKNLRDSNYPKNNGLHDCSVMVWRNSPGNEFLQNEWWGQCSKYKRFDQSEIHYLAWFNGRKITPIELTPGSFHLVKHNKNE